MTENDTLGITLESSRNQTDTNCVVFGHYRSLSVVMGQKHVSGPNLLVRVRAHTHTRGGGIISAMPSRYYDEFKKRLIEEDPVKRLSIYGACSGIVVGMQSHELGCPFDLFRCENEKIIWSRFAHEEKWNWG